MTQRIELHKLIGSEEKYDISVFSQDRIDWLEKKIKKENGKLYFECLIRKKLIQVKPEEIVQQLMIDKLYNEYIQIWKKLKEFLGETFYPPIEEHFST